MKTKRWWMTAGLAGVLCLGAGKVRSQDAAPGRGGFGGNFDPAQIQRFIMDGYREQLEVTDDAEWTLIEGRIQKVTDARLEGGAGGLGGIGRLFRRGGGGGQGGARGGGERGGFGAFFPEPSREEEALQKAVDTKASNAELKTELAKFLEARKQKQARLEQAQAELRKVLSVRQEAIATLLGLL